MDKKNIDGVYNLWVSKYHHKKILRMYKLLIITLYTFI